jgi:hypothetical protein
MSPENPFQSVKTFTPPKVIALAAAVVFLLSSSVYTCNGKQ